MSITVRVPATTANMGPGFDSLGCAFALYNRVTFSYSDQFEIIGCDKEFCNENNLAFRAFVATCEYAGVAVPTVKIEISADIPVSSGLGSSASMWVAGAMGADRLLKLSLSKHELCEIASRLEGHPDNVAPAVFGGLTAALQEGDECFVANYPISPLWKFCAFITTDIQISTQEARRALPTYITHKDAIFNTTHLALLPAALMYGDIALLQRTLKDRLHEPYRAPLIADFDALKESALAFGAHTFFLSGSGPTCMAIYTDDAFVDRMNEKVSELSHSWRVLPLTIDREGVLQI